MHKYKKNEQKFIFRLVFSVFGLRGVAVASVFPRISLICTDLFCYPYYPCSSVRSVGITRKKCTYACVYANFVVPLQRKIVNYQLI